MWSHFFSETVFKELTSWILRTLGVSTLFCLGTITTSSGQDAEDVSSRRENQVIAAVEAAGGKVNKISAAGPEREVSFFLSSIPARDEQLKDLNAIQNVIWLNLAGTEITDAGLENLKGMPLKKLHLEKTKIGDAALILVSTFQDLEYLNLYGTQVTDAGLDQLMKLKKLKKIYLWQSGFSPEGMKKLQAAVPGLEVIGEVKLVDVAVDEAKPDEAKPDEAKPDEAKPDEAKPDEAKPDEAKPDEAKPDEAKPDEAKPEGDGQEF